MTGLLYLHVLESRCGFLTSLTAVLAYLKVGVVTMLLPLAFQ